MLNFCFGILKGDTVRYRRKAKRKRTSLFQAITDIGGITDPGGDLAAMGLANTFIPGGGKILRQNGQDPDKVREAMVEAGFLPEGATVNDLFAAMDREARGTKVYRPEETADAEREAAEARMREDNERYINDAASDMGVMLSQRDMAAVYEILSNSAINAQEAIEQHFERPLEDGEFSEQRDRAERADEIPFAIAGDGPQARASGTAPQRQDDTGRRAPATSPVDREYAENPSAREEASGERRDVASTEEPPAQSDIEETPVQQTEREALRQDESEIAVRQQQSKLRREDQESVESQDGGLFETKQEELFQKRPKPVELTGKELYSGKSLTALQRLGERYYRSNLQGKKVIHPTVGEILLSGGGQNKSRFEGANADKWRLYPALEKIIKRGVEVGRSNNTDVDRKPNVLEYIFLDTDVILAGDPITVRTTIEVHRDGRRFYNLNADPQRKNAPIRRRGVSHDTKGNRFSIPSRTRIIYINGVPEGVNINEIVEATGPVDADAISGALNERLKDLGLTDKVRLNVVEAITSTITGSPVEADGRTVLEEGTKALIEVALTSDDPVTTLNHEVIHALRGAGAFRGPEWRAIEKAVLADTDRLAEVRERYADQSLTEDQIVEEAAADMYADWAQGQVPAKGFLQKGMEMIQKLLGAIREAFGGLRVEDVFGRVEAGEVASRTDGTAAENTAQDPLDTTTDWHSATVEARLFFTRDMQKRGTPLSPSLIPHSRMAKGLA